MDSNFENGQQLMEFKAHPEPVNGAVGTSRINDLVYSPDGKHLATHSGEGTAKVFDAQTGVEILKIKLRIPRDARSGTLAFSRDGKRLAVTSLASDYSASS